MFVELTNTELIGVDGGCNWCKAGDILIAVGGFLLPPVRVVTALLSAFDIISNLF